MNKIKFKEQTKNGVIDLTDIDLKAFLLEQREIKIDGKSYTVKNVEQDTVTVELVNRKAFW